MTAFQLDGQSHCMVTSEGENDTGDAAAVPGAYVTGRANSALSDCRQRVLQEASPPWQWMVQVRNLANAAVTCR
jgi:hypothetical protein